MNFVDAILYHCKSNPVATAISTPGSVIANVKYGQLPGLISAVSHAAVHAGLRPQQTVAILSHTRWNRRFSAVIVDVRADVEDRKSVV